MTSTRIPVLPPAWGDVLNQVQQSLTHALEHADQRLQALEAAFAASAAAPGQHQTRCDAARQQLDATLDGASRQVQDADTALAAVEEALRTWLHTSAAAQQALAEQAARGRINEDRG